ncbi:hypothetical protein [Pannonibacter tanglangensis]|uniref:Uncharacterized protein n=1 Tax=Pannonibacter tanglangensis TaxID=2750084 RepID=A0ABW9ZDQ7_9HYPH|nr:hypothetical protein [Pannonibacter sp. XCT-34]NBN62808.1 hypothetical protein [Pannonibacter sp. XCT-34]
MSSISRNGHATALAGISDAWFHRIKAATRDLVDACGGLVRAGALCNASKSQVGRWRSATDADIIGLAQALVLEHECGVPYVTHVMAELNGRRLGDPDAEGHAPIATVHAQHAESMRAAGEAMASMAAALSDGKITPTEAEAADRAYAELGKSVERFRMSLAALKTPLNVIEGGR